jgi:hypothetical protein
MALRYRSSRDSCSSCSSLSCLRRRKISLRTFTSKPSPLASAKTSFLPSFNALISSSMRSTRSMKEQIRSPEFLPCLSCVLPLQQAHTYAAKVTDRLRHECESPTNAPGERPGSEDGDGRRLRLFFGSKSLHGGGLPRARAGFGDDVKRIRQKGHYAACRGVISARVARPVSVSEYGASNSWPTFATSRFRFRYCMRTFNDRCGLFSEIATSLIRNAPASEIAVVSVTHVSGAPQSASLSSFRFYSYRPSVR